MFGIYKCFTDFFMNFSPAQWELRNICCLAGFMSYLFNFQVFFDFEQFDNQED